jgi:hypothetical protein
MGSANMKLAQTATEIQKPELAFNAGQCQNMNDACTE